MPENRSYKKIVNCCMPKGNILAVDNNLGPSVIINSQLPLSTDLNYR